jgi:cell division transport system permease protein
MQLVGASEQLIQAPFVIEGVVQGLTAGAISLAMLWGMFVFLGKELPTVAGFLAPLSRPEFLDTTSIAMLLAIGSLLGGGGSLFSLRRFIKTWKASGRAA